MAVVISSPTPFFLAFGFMAITNEPLERGKEN
jgi:hypothetical protein